MGQVIPQMSPMASPRDDPPPEEAKDASWPSKEVGAPAAANGSMVGSANEFDMFADSPSKMLAPATKRQTEAGEWADCARVESGSRAHEHSLQVRMWTTATTTRMGTTVFVEAT